MVMVYKGKNPPMKWDKYILLRDDYTVIGCGVTPQAAATDALSSYPMDVVMRACVFHVYIAPRSISINWNQEKVPTYEEGSSNELET